MDRRKIERNTGDRREVKSNKYEQNNEDIRIYQKGGEGCGAALERLVERNKGLIRSTVNRLMRFSSGSLRDDLEQEAWIAFIESAKTFDVKRGIAFSTYVVPNIRWKLEKFKDKDQTVAQPFNSHYQKIKRNTYTAIDQSPLIIDDGCRDNANQMDIGDLFRSDDFERMEQSAENFFARKIFKAKWLSKKERLILKLRYDGQGETLRSVGIKLGVCYETIRNEEKRIFKKIRDRFDE